MKFNYFGKTKIVLAALMIVITLVYVFSMTGSFIKYEEIDYKTDAAGNVLQDENGDPIEIINKVDASELSFIWFPTVHAKVLGGELEEYIGEDYEYNINDIAPVMVLIFIIGIVVAVLAVVSFFTSKKIIWTVFAAIWGVLAAYSHLLNPAMKAAGNIECLSGAGGLVTIQTILAFLGLIVGVAALIISVYAKNKNNKMLLESILKRD